MLIISYSKYINRYDLWGYNIFLVILSLIQTSCIQKMDSEEILHRSILVQRFSQTFEKVWAKVTRPTGW